MLICCINVMYTYIDRQPSLSVGSMTLPIMQQQFTTKRATGGPFRALNFRCMVEVVLLCVNKKHGDSYTAYIWDFQSELFFSYFIFFLHMALDQLHHLLSSRFEDKHHHYQTAQKSIRRKMCNCNGQKNSDVSSVALVLLPAATKDKWIINASMKFLGCILSFVLSYFSCLVTLKSNSKTQADEKALKKSFIALAIYGQIKVWFCAMFQFDQSFASISLKRRPRF